MRHFPQIDPLTIKQHPNLVASLPDEQQPTKTWYFLIIDDYMLIANATYFTNKRTGESKWLHYQIEFPKQGLIWYLDTIRNKFFKTEAQGGLPKGEIGASDVINGEELAIVRAINADGNGGGGYSFVTVDRKDALPKSYTFTDALLFEHGLMHLLENIAGKIRAGVL